MLTCVCVCVCFLLRTDVGQGCERLHLLSSRGPSRGLLFPHRMQQHLAQTASVAMTPRLCLGSHRRRYPVSTRSPFVVCLVTSPRSRGARLVCSSVRLVGSRCAGSEKTPTSALLCSRGDALAPPGCPWDN